MFISADLMIFFKEMHGFVEIFSKNYYKRKEFPHDYLFCGSFLTVWKFSLRIYTIKVIVAI